MSETPEDRKNRSLVLVHPSRKTGMQKHHAVQRSIKLHQLSRVLFAKLAHFLRRVLSVLIAGFMIIIHKFRRKADQHYATAQAVEEPHTESGREEQELERATQLEDKFISMASHELKTPMTTISGNTQLILRRLSRLPELSSELTVMRNALERINAQTWRLNALVDQLLDLNNLRAGQIDLQVKACNLVDLCREVVEDQLFLTGRIIELNVPQLPVIVQADYDRISQVLVNLITNAIKYCPEEAQLKVCLDQNDGVALIQVSDTGPGIPEDQHAHIFEPFYRSPDVQFTPRSGLGLGLAICKEVVERHHGRIWCVSQVGKGSTFFVELPLRQG